MKDSMIYTDKQLKYLRCLLKTWINMNYLTGEDLNYKPSTVDQASLIILCWVRFLIKD